MQAVRNSIVEAERGSDGLPMSRHRHYAPAALSKSIVHGLDGNYELARQFGEEALLLGETDTWRPLYAWGLMIAGCEQGDYEEVRELTKILLQHFVELRIVPFIFLGISFAAILAAYYDENARPATELLALVSTHRSSMSGWLKIWSLIERLHEHLENELGTETFGEAWERGKNLEWEFVATDLLAEYENSHSSNGKVMIFPAHVLEANAQLLEPLSERELEVLLKIAEGYSNSEIAEQLFVGLSTVKKHITHIYGKLEVESRTQALIRAQELNLL
jgi:DNA-binding CsgD family transcriptional regulator